MKGGRKGLAWEGGGAKTQILSNLCVCMCVCVCFDCSLLAYFNCLCLFIVNECGLYVDGNMVFVLARFWYFWGQVVA